MLNLALYSNTELNCRGKIWGEVEKNSGHSGLMASKLCVRT